MVSNTQDAGKNIHAGLYARVKGKIRSLNWSGEKNKLTNVPEAETQCPWAGVAEWLRVAHSLLDDKTVELTRNAD